MDYTDDAKVASPPAKNRFDMHFLSFVNREAKDSVNFLAKSNLK